MSLQRQMGMQENLDEQTRLLKRIKDALENGSGSAGAGGLEDILTAIESSTREEIRLLDAITDKLDMISKQLIRNYRYICILGNIDLKEIIGEYHTDEDMMEPLRSLEPSEVELEEEKDWDFFLKNANRKR